MRTVPPTLYKYRSLAGDAFRRTQDIFLEDRIYYSRIANLNDPAEGHHIRHFDQTIDPLQPQYGALAADSTTTQVMNKWGILSLSAKADDIVMWSHYADAHRGICIEFDTTLAFGSALPVKYSASHPRVDATVGGEPRAIAETICLTKAPQWEYEQEWRVLIEHSGLFTFEPKAISSVILGARFDDEDCSVVKRWLSSRAVRPMLKRAELTPSAFGVSVTQFA